ncbi:MAG TPA: glycosyl hydrolase family 79 C-terminal domain-containing protein [Terriglobales bacterium]|nr:glycosyl hydrolase family 79 C-terminal domain-containing protein [Terriglobales bacterium]
MNRRDFIQLSTMASVAALPALSHAAPADVSTPTVRASIRADRILSKIPEDFTGLSYESAQLANPGFFSGDNTQLIGFVRRLGKAGVLRLGGNTSEYCYWTPSDKTTPVASNDNVQRDQTTQIGFGFTVGPDTGKKAPASVNITPAAIHNLRDFVDATGWTLIYGLNMGTGTPEDAAAEAAYVMDVLGPKLISFQLCNEPDIFSRNGLRPADYAFAKFAEEWRRYFQAVRARVPKAQFAGPDTAYNTAWLVPFARQFKNDVSFLSQHYYAEGPPTDPSMTIERLLSPNPKLQQEFDGMKQTREETGLPFRLAETNSCYQGGKPGVSDTFTSALWATDLMYQLASAGGMGINFHGGGYGWYTPIAGSVEDGFNARPIFYGMLLFALAGSGQLVECKLEGGEQTSLLTVYALRSNDGQLKLAIFNKNLDRRVRLVIDSIQAQNGKVIRLHAPRVSDTTDVTIGSAPIGANGAWSAAHEELVAVDSGAANLDMPPASAALVTFTA